MQVKRIQAPAGLDASPFGQVGFYVAQGREVADYTTDICARERRSDAVDSPVSVYAAVPMSLDVLTGAVMVSFWGFGLDHIAAMSDDDVRSWAITSLLDVGATAVLIEISSEAWADSYRTGSQGGDGQPSDAEDGQFYRTARERIQRAFGFPDPDTHPAAAPVPAPRLRRRGVSTSHRVAARVGALAPA